MNGPVIVGDRRLKGLYAADDATCGMCEQPAPATIYRGRQNEPICEVCFHILLEEMEKAELRNLLGGIEL